MSPRIQRRAKGLVVRVACARPAEVVERISCLVTSRLPGGRTRDAEAFWWFAHDGYAMSCPNTYGDDLAAAEYLRVLREISRELAELSFEVGFEPIVYPLMWLRSGSFGEDDEDVTRFIEHG